ncbi:MAG: enoyl-CoA hydratase/isomerase family protein [Actinobacteria bacterium]|nr:enoyl-CoA hydratase/isomerase family protein [Actinomycetota bacterium]
MVAASVQGPVGLIELQRPERHNSLVPELLEDLLAAHREMADAGVGAAVLAAAGPTFSTGGDIKGIMGADDTVANAARLVGLLNEVILAMVGGPVPMVGAVHGVVTGGSIGLVLACDHVVMGSQVTMRPWYAAVGFAPDGGWTALLPERIGSLRARSILLTDATVSAAEALQWGIADEVVPAPRVRERALAAAARIAGGKAGTRAVIRRLAGPDLEALAARLEAERQAFLELVVGDEARDGMDRFLRGDLT